MDSREVSYRKRSFIVLDREVPKYAPLTQISIEQLQMLMRVESEKALQMLDVRFMARPDWRASKWRGQE